MLRLDASRTMPAILALDATRVACEVHHGLWKVGALAAAGGAVMVAAYNRWRLQCVS